MILALLNSRLKLVRFGNAAQNAHNPLGSAASSVHRAQVEAADGSSQ